MTNAEAIETLRANYPDACFEQLRCAVDMAIKALEEPQRKKGKWIDTTQGDHYKCSCCGTRAAFWFDEENSSSWEKDMSEWLSDYCPNCGADMRKDGAADDPV